MLSFPKNGHFLLSWCRFGWTKSSGSGLDQSRFKEKNLFDNSRFLNNLNKVKRFLKVVPDSNQSTMGGKRAGSESSAQAVGEGRSTCHDSASLGNSLLGNGSSAPRLPIDDFKSLNNPRNKENRVKDLS